MRKKNGKDDKIIEFPIEAIWQTQTVQPTWMSNLNRCIQGGKQRLLKNRFKSTLYVIKIENDEK